MSSKRYPSPKELIALLETNPKKAKNAFHGRNGGHCCLGHYANLCELVGKGGQGAFDHGKPKDDGRVALPADHWLFQKVEDPKGGDLRELQGLLSDLNDTTVGYAAVIEVLKTVPATGGKKRETPEQRKARNERAKAKKLVTA